MGGDAGEVSILKKAVFSGIGGAVATTTIYPIDMVKTLLQNQNKAQTGTPPPSGAKPAPRPFKGPADVFVRTLRESGPRGLFRGWPPAVIFVMPEKALKITMNDIYRDLLRPKSGDLPLWAQMAAGASAGATQCIVTAPMELLKIQGAVSKSNGGGGGRGSAGSGSQKISYTKLMRNLGGQGLYTGSVATLLRDVPFSFVYFPMYSVVLSFLTANDTTTTENAMAENTRSENTRADKYNAEETAMIEEKKNTMIEEEENTMINRGNKKSKLGKDSNKTAVERGLLSSVLSRDSGHVSAKAFLSGAVAGTFAAALSTPMDVVKTRVHGSVEPVRGLSAAQFVAREVSLVSETTGAIWRREGLGAFFKGVVPRCAIVSPLFAITMQVYEGLKILLG